MAPLLEDIVEDLQNIRYLADGYRDAFTRVNNGMKEAGKSFESLKRGYYIYVFDFYLFCDDTSNICIIYPNTTTLFQEQIEIKPTFIEQGSTYSYSG